MKKTKTDKALASQKNLFLGKERSSTAPAHVGGDWCRIPAAR